MLSEREVISTLNMLRNEHLDVRTVTLGVSLFDCVSHDLELFTAKCAGQNPPLCLTACFCL